MPFFLRTPKSYQGVDCAGWIFSEDLSRFPGALYAQDCLLVIQQKKSRAKVETRFVHRLATSSFVTGMSVDPQASNTFLAEIL